VCLTGDDLPIAIALKPRISDVTTRFEILSENRFALVRIVTEYSGVPNNPALNVLNVDRSGISAGQRCDVGGQLRLSKMRRFSSAKMQSSAKYFFTVPACEAALHRKALESIGPIRPA
jgi:hypothetical protein